MVLKLAFLIYRSENHFEIPCRGLGTNVSLTGILGQKVGGKKMADAESQPGEPVK